MKSKATKKKTAMKIVIKVGTSSIVNNKGELNTVRMTKLASEIVNLRSKGHKVILVSSGAVGCGRRYIKLNKNNPFNKQILAALGQPDMFKTWQQIFQFAGDITSAQLLYTSFDLNPNNKMLYKVTKKCLEKILAIRILPIINENDGVSLEELNSGNSFGDNANLAALVAKMIKADVLFIATDTNGFLDGQGKTIKRIEKLDNFCLKPLRQKKSTLGTGGAQATLEAAKIACKNNIKTIIFNSADDNALTKITSGLTNHHLPKDIDFTYIPTKK